MALVRVFLVDDSAVVRTIIGRRLSEAGFEVVGTAMNGKDALRKIPVLRPEVVVMDVEMPELDGLNALRELMTSYPVPVIMLSAHTQAGSRATIEALALGAVDFVPKPTGSAGITAIIAELAVKIGAAAGVSLRGVLAQAAAPATPRARAAPAAVRASKRKTDLVVIGCSTGGPNALRALLPGFPANLPAAVVVVQHMPAGFTALLAEHLDAVCAMEVRHAQDNDPIMPGRVLVAPAGRAFQFRPGPDGVRVRVSEDNTPPAPGTFRPSVDQVMTQAAAIYESRVMGVLLTGMGRDGAGGMLAIRQKNGYTIAQDEPSCVIYGMPRAAVENGAARRVLPLSEISAEVVQQL